MKMNRLIVVNTYSQLTVALQLLNTLFNNDKVSLIISDHSNNSETIYETIKGLHIFYKVYYKATKKYCDANENLWDKLTCQYHLIRGQNIFYDIAQEQWDELIYYNTDPATHILYSTIIKSNPSLKAAWYEEGIMSYTTPFMKCRKYDIMRMVLQLIGCKDLESITEKFYCFYPTEYHGCLQPIKIPLLSREDDFIKKTLKKIFNIRIQDNDYSYKYIFFSGVYDFEGGKSIGELDIICEIAECVGKDNLLVKVHPRDKAERFQAKGLNVDMNSHIPWEAVQINYDFSRNIFLTTLSGSVLFINMMIKEPTLTYIVYPLCKIHENECAMRNARDIENFIDKGIDGKKLKWLNKVDCLDNILPIKRDINKR